MTIHKEGFRTILYTFSALLLINYILFFIKGEITFSSKVFALVSFFLFIIIVNFFRSPRRIPFLNDDAVMAPADGKVVVIEEVEETEFLHTTCKQVSIFMSPFNVHVNWYPINGIIKYFKHHSGRKMAAYLPKSSTENERTTVVIEHENGAQLLMRQIAGAMARRIVCYAREESTIKQGSEVGFIKFGSRVDIFFPADARISVELDQKVKGKQTIIGWLK